MPTALPTGGPGAGAVPPGIPDRPSPLGVAPPLRPTDSPPRSVRDEAERSARTSALPQPPLKEQPAVGRRARLAVQRIDPLSACGVAFVLSTVVGIAGVVAVAVLQAVLDSAGVTDSLNAVLVDQLQLPAVLGTSKVLVFAAVVAALQVVVGTLLAGLLAMAYNLTASFTGGLGLVLRDRS